MMQERKYSSFSTGTQTSVSQAMASHFTELSGKNKLQLQSYKYDCVLISTPVRNYWKLTWMPLLLKCSKRNFLINRQSTVLAKNVWNGRKPPFGFVFLLLKYKIIYCNYSYIMSTLFPKSFDPTIRLVTFQALIGATQRTRDVNIQDVAVNHYTFLL